MNNRETDNRVFIALLIASAAAVEEVEEVEAVEVEEVEEVAAAAVDVTGTCAMITRICARFGFTSSSWGAEF